MKLFKKQSTIWTVATLRVSPYTPGAIRETSESRKWYGTVGSKQVPLSVDKATAIKMLRKLQTDADLAKHGLGDPFAPHRNKTIEEHLQDYETILLGKGSGKGHVKKAIGRIRAIVSGCKFKVLADIDQTKVSAWLSDQRENKTEIQLPKVDSFRPSEAAALLGVSHTALSSMVKRHSLAVSGNGKARRLPRPTLEFLVARMARGISPETTNHYVRTIRAFCRWLVRSHRMERNPLEDLSLLNSQVEVRRARRELTADELRRLLDGTLRSSRSFRGLNGTDRACLYLTAAATGLRARALANLAPRDFELQGETPVVNLPARFNKTKKSKLQPVPCDTAVVLANYLSTKPATSAVWGTAWQSRGAEMIRLDLEEAGILYVIEGSHGPEYADFHALRHSYLTLLGRSGVDLRTAQVLAGHSSPMLTARYSHRNLNDLTEAVSKLPNLTNLKARDCNLQPRVNFTETNVCTQFARSPADLGYLQPSPDTEAELEEVGLLSSKTTRKLAETLGFAGIEVNGPSRIRTCNQGIMSRQYHRHKVYTTKDMCLQSSSGCNMVAIMDLLS